MKLEVGQRRRWGLPTGFSRPEDDGPFTVVATNYKNTGLVATIQYDSGGSAAAYTIRFLEAYSYLCDNGLQRAVKRVR